MAKGRPGEVTATPRGGATWMIYVPPQHMPDGGRTPAYRRVHVAYSKTEALQFGRDKRVELIKEYEQRRRGEIEASRPKAPTFAEAAEVWLEYKRTQAAKGEKKLSAIEAIESTLRLHVLPFVASVRIDEFTDDVVDRLEAAWVKGGYEYMGPWGRPVKVKPLARLSTRNNRISPVNAILKFHVDRKKLRGMPCTIKVPSVEADEAAHYEPVVYESLLEAALLVSLTAYVIVLLGGEAGLRRGEIIGLDKADVDFTAGEIVVRRSVYWRKKVRYEGVPKGKRIKRVPCTPRLLAALKKICHHRQGRVLVSDEGAELTPKMLKRVIMKVEKAAGREQTGRCHIMRHSFCSHLAQANVPLIAIAGLARHSDLRVTQRYMHLAPGSLRQGIDMLVKSREAAGPPSREDESA